MGHTLYAILHTCTDRVAESREPFLVDYTGQIRQFSEIGPGGDPAITPRPWVCYSPYIYPGSDPFVQWQTPDGNVSTEFGGTFANGSQLFQIAISGGLALCRGPQYNSPDGEYCCVITGTYQRRCVTLSECASTLTKHFM